MTSKKSTKTTDKIANIANRDTLQQKRATEKQANRRQPSVTVYLDDETHMRLKMMSVRERRSMADLCREQMEKLLDEYEKKNN